MNNKTSLMSAIAFGALMTMSAPQLAFADASSCAHLSSKALQQRMAAGKCDGATPLSPEMMAALAFAKADDKTLGHEDGNDPQDKPVEDADKGDEAAGDEGAGTGDEDAGDEGAGAEDAGAGHGAGKSKKLPGDTIVQKKPSGDIDIKKTPVVKKPQGDVIIGEEIEELEYGTPDDHEPAIAEEIEELEYGTPENKKPILAEEVDELEFGTPEKGEPVKAEKVETLFFGLPIDGTDAYANDHDGKDGHGDKGGKSGNADKGGKESKGPKGGNGIAG